MLLSLRESCQAMWNTAVMYAGRQPWSLLLSVAALLYLLIASPDFRKKLLLPVVILLLLVFNPVLYSLVYGNNNLPFVTRYGLRYWRFFWMLPQSILIGLAAMDILRRLPSAPLRCAALAVAAGIILLTGPSMYQDTRQFKPAGTPYKLGVGVPEACEAILQDDPHPLCMFDDYYCAQVREYSGDIRQMWGRDGVWNLIPDAEALEMFNALQQKQRDWDRIFTYAREHGVTHISFRILKAYRKEMLEAAKAYGYGVLQRRGGRYVLHRVET